MEIINYPAQVIWHKNITSKLPIDNFSPRHRKRLSASLKKIADLPISHQLNEVDDAFIDWFQDFYSKTINTKTNPNLGNIRETIEKYSGKSLCFGLKLYENNTVIGGAIYIHKKNRITTAFKVFLPQWEAATLPISPSLYAEYVLYSHAITHNYTTISHGQDRNPYGLNSDIGLCSFKLSLGYVPRVSSNNVTEQINTAQIKSTCLILNLPKQSELIITEADLYIKEEEMKSAQMLLNYEETLTVRVHFLDHAQLS